MFDGMINISQHTLKELLKYRDGSYLRHDERVEELSGSEIVRVYASTVEFRTKSSKYAENGTYWKQWILLKDFVTIAKDKQISLKDAIEYALESADVHIACNCPSHKYWAYEYMATQLDYAYGPYRNNRKPKRNNTGLRGTLCKHGDLAVRTLLDNKEDILKQFAVYYKRLPGFPKDMTESLDYVPGLDTFEEPPERERDTPEMTESGEAGEQGLEIENTDEAEQLIDDINREDEDGDVVE